MLTRYIARVENYWSGVISHLGEFYSSAGLPSPCPTDAGWNKNIDKHTNLDFDQIFFFKYFFEGEELLANHVLQKKF